jgi:Xaa-Pro aminopeptidase
MDRVRTGGYLDRRRAERLMHEHGLDALLLIQPESIAYASGAHPGVATSWRRAGAAMMLVPADAREPLAAIVGDLQARDFQAASGIADTRTHALWVDAADVSGKDLSGRPVRSLFGSEALRPRPTTFDRDRALGLLRDLLEERHLIGGRIGTEHAFLPLADAAAFEQSCPQVRWSDASGLVARLRMIKSSEEMGHLRAAGLSAEVGVHALIAAVRPGIDAREMEMIWREAALAEARRLGVDAAVQGWAYISVGTDGFAPGGPVRPGDIIKVDVGCVVRGYSSDSARTFVLGSASQAAQEIYSALRCAFEAGLGRLKVGNALRDVHLAATQAMHEAGFRSYARGHFGHGLGASIWSEEWPFIGADADVVIEEGMVLAFETPWYVRGVGALMLEDQFAITSAGSEALWSLSREMIAIPY